MEVILHPKYGVLKRLSFSTYHIFQGSQTYVNDIALLKSSADEEAKFATKCQPNKMWPACWQSLGYKVNYHIPKLCLFC